MQLPTAANDPKANAKSYFFPETVILYYRPLTFCCPSDWSSFSFPRTSLFVLIFSYLPEIKKQKLNINSACNRLKQWKKWHTHHFCLCVSGTSFYCQMAKIIFVLYLSHFEIIFFQYNFWLKTTPKLSYEKEIKFCVAVESFSNSLDFGFAHVVEKVIVGYF